MSRATVDIDTYVRLRVVEGKTQAEAYLGAHPNYTGADTSLRSIATQFERREDVAKAIEEAQVSKFKEARTSIASTMTDAAERLKSAVSNTDPQNIKALTEAVKSLTAIADRVGLSMPKQIDIKQEVVHSLSKEQIIDQLVTLLEQNPPLARPLAQIIEGEVVEGDAGDDK